MIKADFYKINKTEELFVGFTIKGHSGYAESGSDIVCASVSSMVMLFVNMVNDVFQCEFDFKSNEKKASVDFELTKPLDAESECAIKGIKTLYLCIKSVSDDYPDFVKVTETVKKS